MPLQVIWQPKPKRRSAPWIRSRYYSKWDKTPMVY